MHTGLCYLVTNDFITVYGSADGVAFSDVSDLTIVALDGVPESLSCALDNGTVPDPTLLLLDLDERGPCIAENSVLDPDSFDLLVSQLPYDLTLATPEFDFPYDDCICTDDLAALADYEIYSISYNPTELIDYAPTQASLAGPPLILTVSDPHPVGTYDYVVYLEPLDTDNFSSDFKTFYLTVTLNTPPSLSQPPNYQVELGSLLEI